MTIGIRTSHCSLLLTAICFHGQGNFADVTTTAKMMVPPDSVKTPTMNQVWSSLFMDLSFDPGKFISSQSKIKVPPASQRLLEFGTLLHHSCCYLYELRRKILIMYYSSLWR
jgi:hypothetical protein